MQGGDKGRPREVFQFDALDGHLNFCDCSDQRVCQIAICIKTKTFQITSGTDRLEILISFPLDSNLENNTLIDQGWTIFNDGGIYGEDKSKWSKWWEVRVIELWKKQSCLRVICNQSDQRDVEMSTWFWILIRVVRKMWMFWLRVGIPRSNIKTKDHYEVLEPANQRLRVEHEHDPWEERT